MAREYLSLGSAPSDEECAQVGTDSYPEQSRVECNLFVEQLRRTFGPEPEGARITIKSFPHDFGTYREVVVWYDEQFAEAIEYAMKLEGDGPNEWDDIARRELALHGFAR